MDASVEQRRFELRNEHRIRYISENGEQAEEDEEDEAYADDMERVKTLAMDGADGQLFMRVQHSRLQGQGRHFSVALNIAQSKEAKTMLHHGWILALIVSARVIDADSIPEKWLTTKKPPAKLQPATPRFSEEAPEDKHGALGEPGLVVKRWFPDTATTSSAAVWWQQRDGYMKCNSQWEVHNYELEKYKLLYRARHQRPQSFSGSPHIFQTGSFHCFILQTDYSPAPLNEFTRLLREQGRIDDLISIAALLLAAGAQINKNGLVHGNINPDNVIVGRGKQAGQLLLHLVNLERSHSLDGGKTLPPYKLKPGYEPPELPSTNRAADRRKVDAWAAAATAFTAVIGRPLHGAYYSKDGEMEAWSARSLDASMAEITIATAKKKLSYDTLPAEQQKHLHDLSEVLHTLLEPEPEERRMLEEVVKPAHPLFAHLRL
ncbi:hypothetical protein SYNPS1DRAFT_21666 [Syncephalis pseudoplumigaleata]|uniref:Protein kinase domain-containing protein n=1 Tax=Syncephalis pseudoplumigaleata TaxID=1712513 RepID=A0A4P9Z271_9FUNG|nr:hypothetical protein SYNPS1DRAFT_21666 [Syncephalis pseudoplumigaleata]|eukprot:RKP26603.1 hypothetical protein SYNPS1DRAFT_21666 [Syncephalis pseudoplumigaleata]